MSETSTGNYIDRPASSMTLRDYFAAKAMQSIEYNGLGLTDQEIAKFAYKMADAMMKERNK